MIASAGTQTVPQALEFWAARTPDAVALLSPGQASVSYGELLDAATRFAAELRAFGLEAHDVIAVVFPDGLELCLALLATMSVGIAVPLVWPGPEREYRRILANRRVRAVVAAAEAADAVRRSVGSVLPIITASGDSSGRFGHFRLQGSVTPVREPVDTTGLDDVAVILQSSGSTGKPKLIPRTHQNIVSFCREFIAARAVTPDDRGLSLARTTSSRGLHTLVTTMFAGSSLVVVPTFDRRALGSWLRDFRPTYLSATPAVLRGIAPEQAALREAVLRCVFATSAPLLAEETERLESALGAPILNMYGMTEATAIAAEHYPREYRVPGAVGPAWCDVQVMSKRGERLGPNEVGELLVRGPRVSPGYLDDPDLNAAAFLPGGWLRTGDLGFRDEAGYIHLRGRLGEIVNRGGEKIDPDEVDAVLRGCPGVHDAGTFAVPDPLLGEDIVAAVVLAPSAAATARQLRGWLLDHLPPYASPRRIWFVVDLPRTETGKIRRTVLQERYLREVGA